MVPMNNTLQPITIRGRNENGGTPLQHKPSSNNQTGGYGRQGMVLFNPVPGRQDLQFHTYQLHFVFFYYRAKYLEQIDTLDRAKPHLAVLKRAEARDKTLTGMAILVF